MINKKLSRLTPYEPLTGEYRVRLDANESFLAPSEALLDEIRNAVGRTAFNRYPDPYARLLCERFADYYDLSPENITAGNGSDELIGLITSAFLQKGERVLTFRPDFSMYGFYAYLYENQVVSLDKDDALKIDVDEAISFINANAVKAVLFSNPCNPTSVGIKREAVIKLVSSVDALVVLDEAYMDFWDQSLLDSVNDFDNLIILRTCSKAIGFAAVRLGFAVTNKAFTAALRAAKAPYNVNSVTQAIGTAVLSRPGELRTALKEIIAQRDYLQAELKKLSPKWAERIYDSDANFIFIKTAQAEKIYRYLLDQSIAVRQIGQNLRITAGSGEENRLLLEAIKEYENSCM